MQENHPLFEAFEGTIEILNAEYRVSCLEVAEYFSEYINESFKPYFTDDETNLLINQCNEIIVIWGKMKSLNKPWNDAQSMLYGEEMGSIIKQVRKDFYNIIVSKLQPLNI